MLIKKSFNCKILMLLCIVFLINSNSYAESEEKSLDIYGALGYTRLGGFSFNKTKKLFNEFSGANLAVSALYSLKSSSQFKPILGIGLNSVSTDNSDKSSENPDISSIESTFQYVSIVGHGGLKFLISRSFSLYGLANLGYSFRNSFESKFKSDDRYINYANDNTFFKIKDHYFYGATLMGAYKFGDMFSLGGNFTYNRHLMQLEYITYSYSEKESSSFNEYSTNIVAMWSF